MTVGAGTNGSWPSSTGEVSVRALVKMCALAVAATLMASGAVEGDPTVPIPKRSRSLPAEITGTTPALATFATAATSASPVRIALRAAAREVDHVHAVSDGRFEGGNDLRRVGAAAAAQWRRQANTR